MPIQPELWWFNWMFCFHFSLLFSFSREMWRMKIPFRVNQDVLDFHQWTRVVLQQVKNDPDFVKDGKALKHVTLRGFHLYIFEFLSQNISME